MGVFHLQHLKGIFLKDNLMFLQGLLMKIHFITRFPACLSMGGRNLEDYQDLIAKFVTSSELSAYIRKNHSSDENSLIK